MQEAHQPGLLEVNLVDCSTPSSGQCQVTACD